MVETQSTPFVSESILDSIKLSLGLESSYTPFDQEAIMDINAAIAVLTQLGVGPDDGFEITSSLEKWADLLPSPKYFNLAKTYIYLTVKLLLDPPETSYAREALVTRATEYEWRIRSMQEGLSDD